MTTSHHALPRYISAARHGLSLRASAAIAYTFTSFVSSSKNAFMTTIVRCTPETLELAYRVSARTVAFRSGGKARSEGGRPDVVA